MRSRRRWRLLFFFVWFLLDGFFVFVTGRLGQPSTSSTLEHVEQMASLREKVMNHRRHMRERAMSFASKRASLGLPNTLPKPAQSKEAFKLSKRIDRLLEVMENKRLAMIKERLRMAELHGLVMRPADDIMGSPTRNQRPMRRENIHNNTTRTKAAVAKLQRLRLVGQETRARGRVGRVFRFNVPQRRYDITVLYYSYGNEQHHAQNHLSHLFLVVFFGLNDFLGVSGVGRIGMFWNL